MTQPWNPLRNSVTQSYLDPQEKIKDLRRQLKGLRENLERKKDDIRYIIDHHDSNLSGTSLGEDQSLLQRIARDVSETNGKVNTIEQELGSLSINFDRLSTRVQNTEF